MGEDWKGRGAAKEEELIDVWKAVGRREINLQVEDIGYQMNQGAY